MIRAPGCGEAASTVPRRGNRAVVLRCVCAAVLAVVAPVTVPAPAADVPTVVPASEDDAFQVFLNVRRDIVLRCIYRPSNSEVIWGALAGLKKRLDPVLAAQVPAPDPGRSEAEAWVIYKQTLRAMAKSAGSRMDLKSLVEQSIQAYCQGIDAYSKYDDAQTWETSQKFQAPEYVGVGIALLHDRTDDVVCNPWPNGPADRAGVEQADRLLAIGDHPAHGATDMILHNWLYESGAQKVTIRVQHQDGTQATLTIPMQRVVTAQVSIEQGEDDVRISVHRITPRAADDFRAAMRSLGPRRAITLDLRGNGGGDVSAAVAIASVFLPAKTLIGKLETVQNTETLVSTNATPYVPSRLTILQDRFTASASELIITALSGYAPLRVRTVGEKTFGKGVTQRQVKVSDTDNTGVGNIHAGVLTITDSRMYGPRGEVWDEKGLEANR